MLGAGNLVAAIVPKETDRLIGVIGCEMQDPGEAELGYWIAEDHWGKGLGREAATAMTDHAFEVMGHEALVASYQVGNAASQRILEGLGFRRTGEGRSFSRARNSEADVVFLETGRCEGPQAMSLRSPVRSEHLVDVGSHDGLAAKTAIVLRGGQMQVATGHT